MDVIASGDEAMSLSLVDVRDVNASWNAISGRCKPEIMRVCSQVSADEAILPVREVVDQLLTNVRMCLDTLRARVSRPVAPRRRHDNRYYL